MLGGGLVQGSVVLLGGDPGIGKSTLALQACGALARQGCPVLYVAGEESPEQVRLRADRLGLGDAGVLILPETDDRGRDRADRRACARRRSSSTRSRRCTRRRSRRRRAASARCASRRRCSSTHCKASGVACFLIGHVTKEGALAGPRVLEHLVDTVLYFEGDGAHALRVLRAVKNRFGSTNEVGVFEMGESGLVEVANPSAAFLAERPAGAPGSAVLATLEGSRPVLVEIQALVSRSALAMPRRTAIGLDPGRVALLLAVLEKRLRHAALRSGRVPERRRRPARRRAGRRPRGRGGGRVERRAAARCPDDVVVWGEVGLTGEVRSVARAEARLREAARQGFRRCVLPAGNVRGLAGRRRGRAHAGRRRARRSSSTRWTSHDDRRPRSS